MRDSWKCCPSRKEEDHFPLKRSDADRKGEMKILMVRWRSGGRGLRLSRFAWRLPASQLGFVLLTVSLAGIAGYGFVATPSTEGWTHEHDADGGDVFRSPRMVVRLAPGNLPAEKLPQPMPLDALNRQLRDPYFGGGGGQGPYNDALLVTTADGKMLVHMRNWSMAPERADVAQQDIGAKGYLVAATFDSPSDEHYYGLGQQQKGWMDLRDDEIRCWHDYGAIGGEDVCVPFIVSSRGYGLIWDNPSKTTVDLGFNNRNVWSSEVGDRVSYFVIAGETSDAVYEGYRLVTGVTHLLP